MRVRLLKTRAAPARGTTLLEGLIAAAVFAIGLTGAMQGIVVASRQNSMADRMQRGSAVGAQVRRGLESISARRLLEAGSLLDPANCSSDAAVKEVAGDIAALPNACVIDFDAFEAGLVAASKPPLVADYPQTNRDIFRRVLVYRPMDLNTDLQLEVVGIVVGWKDLGLQRRYRTFLALHDPTRNQLNIEL